MKATNQKGLPTKFGVPRVFAGHEESMAERKSKRTIMYSDSVVVFSMDKNKNRFESFKCIQS